LSALSKLFTFNIGAIHSSLLKLLDNPLYAGLIWLPAFEGKPEWYIKALHEAIIPESIFWLAHEIIKGRSGNRARPKADFTLRGIMRCECGTHLKAGFSEGKKKYYMHYQCTKGKGRNFRGQIVKISTYAKEELSKATNYKTVLLEAKYSEFNSVAEKIEKLEEKMLNDVIDPSTYKTWFARLSAERGALENEIIALKRDKQTVFNRLEEGIRLLCNLRNLYISTTLEGQQMLLKKVFEVGIKYDGKVFRTPMINPALVDNDLAMKEKGLLEVEQPDDFLLKSWSCTVSGNWFEPLGRFIETLLYVNNYKLIDGIA